MKKVLISFSIIIGIIILLSSSGYCVLLTEEEDMLKAELVADQNDEPNVTVVGLLPEVSVSQVETASNTEEITVSGNYCDSSGAVISSADQVLVSTQSNAVLGDSGLLEKVEYSDALGNVVYTESFSYDQDSNLTGSVLTTSGGAVVEAKTYGAQGEVTSTEKHVYNYASDSSSLGETVNVYNAQNELVSSTVINAEASEVTDNTSDTQNFAVNVTVTDTGVLSGFTINGVKLDESTMQNVISQEQLDADGNGEVTIQEFEAKKDSINWGDYVESTANSTTTTTSGSANNSSGNQTFSVKVSATNNGVITGFLVNGAALNQSDFQSVVSQEQLDTDGNGEVTIQEFEAKKDSINWGEYVEVVSVAIKVELPTESALIEIGSLGIARAGFNSEILAQIPKTLENVATYLSDNWGIDDIEYPETIIIEDKENSSAHGTIWEMSAEAPMEYYASKMIQTNAPESSYFGIEVMSEYVLYDYCVTNEMETALTTFASENSVSYNSEFDGLVGDDAINGEPLENVTNNWHALSHALIDYRSTLGDSESDITEFNNAISSAFTELTQLCSENPGISDLDFAKALYSSLISNENVDAQVLATCFQNRNYSI